MAATALPKTLATDPEFLFSLPRSVGPDLFRKQLPFLNWDKLACPGNIPYSRISRVSRVIARF
jgi:hypothetical protein